MNIKEIVKEELKKQNSSQTELCQKINITKQNLSNKLNRGNLSALELVEIADVLGHKVMLVPQNEHIKDGYVIDFPDEIKGKPKRKLKADLTE